MEEGSNWELRDIIVSDTTGSTRLVLDENRRVIRLSLKKQSPGMGIVIWWNRVFEDENAPIDTTSIFERRKPTVLTSTKGNVQSAAEAWKDAQQLFNNRIHKLQGEKELITKMMEENENQG